LAKSANLFGERARAEFRAEFFNVLNHAQFDDPNVNNFGSASFGQVTTTTNGFGDRMRGLFSLRCESAFEGA
jgi:hypothetical protein